jgi:prophage antirepressor-like protein
MNNFYENLDKNTIKFENNDINVIIDDNDIPWFNANEIGLALGYKYPKDAIINNVDKEDKLKLEDININYKIDKHPHSIYINESGLYSLLLQSRLPKSKKFKQWITKIVLPSIRKYGYYKLKKEHERDINEIFKKINFLEKQNKKLKNELKTEKFPNGALVYIIDYTDEQDNMYRLGKSDDMENRKKIYDTHSIYKKNVILLKEVNCPLQYETCLRSMLYNYRIKNKKDFYECDINIIKKAFKNCDKSLKCMNQEGGNFNINNNEDIIFSIVNKEIQQLTELKNKKIIKLNKYKNLLNN